MVASRKKVLIFLYFFHNTLVASSIDYAVVLYPVCINYLSHLLPSRSAHVTVYLSLISLLNDFSAAEMQLHKSE